MNNTIATTVHEQQSLKLCAVHALNNLLQLSEDQLETDSWCCGKRRLQLSPSQTIPATKAEFDRIADDLTVAENQLLSSTAAYSDKVNNKGSTLRKISILERLTSNHRTVLLGNYSFEVGGDRYY
jgi:hypothetical protein